MNEKMNALNPRGMWELVDPPSDAMLLGASEFSPSNIVWMSLLVGTM